MTENKYFHLWKWQFQLKLTGWQFNFTSIDKDQVYYDDDIPEDEKYFIGIDISRKAKTGMLYHDRPLKEDDILHELLHVKFPNLTEKDINELTEILIKAYG